VLRVLVPADSASRVSAALHAISWVFANVDLTVELHRLVMCAFACLEEEQNPIGHSLRTLAVAPRKGADRAR
jgi:hypothetical protein